MRYLVTILVSFVTLILAVGISVGVYDNVHSKIPAFMAVIAGFTAWKWSKTNKDVKNQKDCSDNKIIVDQKNYKQALKELPIYLEKLQRKEIDITDNSVEILTNLLKQTIKKYPEKINKAIEQRGSVKIFLVTAISNNAANLLESGQYHIYKGVLNPMGPGKGFLEIFENGLNYLVQLGEIKNEWAEEQKKGLWEKIKNIG